MKKIIFTVTTDLTYDQRMQRICASLAAAGYEVCLMGRVKTNSMPLRPQPYQQIRLSCFFQKGKLFYIFYNLQLFLQLLFTRFDALCAIDLDTLLPAYLVSKLRKKPLVFDAHEYFTEVEEVVNRPMVRKAWLALERSIVPRLQHAYTVSHTIAQVFEQQYRTRFAVIRNISIKADTLPQTPAPTPYLIYIGAVNAGRGLEQIVEAMPQIPCQLYICGDGDKLAAIKTQVAAMQLQHKVKFFGYVEPEKLKVLTAQAYLGFLLLTNSGKSYYYSLANKFFDYIHAGIPQITVDFPEYRHINEVYQVAELIALDVDQIIETTNRLLQDQTRYKQLKANTEHAREALNWQQEEKKLIAFYNQIWQRADV